MPKVKRDEKESSDNSSSSSSDSSEAHDDAPLPKKAKTTAKDSSKRKEDDHTWNLDVNRIIKVKQFKGKVYVDIREYYTKGDELLPGKKGISLTLAQWKAFKDLIPDIDESIQEF